MARGGVPLQHLVHPGAVTVIQRGSGTYQVQGVPNFVVLRNGRVVFRQAGAVDSEQQRRWLRDAAAR